MGKKSKKSSGKGKGKDKDKGAVRRENELPLYRKEQPEVFKTLVDEVNPVLRFNAGQTWICFDDDCFASPTINEKGELVAKRLTIREHGSAAECPICFKPASLKCRKCQSPTEKLSSLDEICRDCLEPADDVFEKIPGFGCHQIEKHWLMNNNSDPICKKIQQHFGWTSGLHDISPLEGYIVSESQYVFFLMHDDNFIGRTDMATSFYGDACFPWAREGKHVRGNLVIFKLMIKNKKRVARNYPALARLICIQTDDDDLQFEYELCPTTKAEVGHMLQERRKAIEQGKYTRRQWRQKVRGKERAVEAEAIHKLSPSAMLLSM
eukprot:scaffold22683_cov92-Skeletonema_marinoi.AAC.1